MLVRRAAIVAAVLAVSVSGCDELLPEFLEALAECERVGCMDPVDVSRGGGDAAPDAYPVDVPDATRDAGPEVTGSAGDTYEAPPLSWDPCPPTDGAARTMDITCALLDGPQRFRLLPTGDPEIWMIMPGGGASGGPAWPMDPSCEAPMDTMPVVSWTCEALQFDAIMQHGPLRPLSQPGRWLGAVRPLPGYDTAQCCADWAANGHPDCSATLAAWVY